MLGRRTGLRACGYTCRRCASNLAPARARSRAFRPVTRDAPWTTKKTVPARPASGTVIRWCRRSDPSIRKTAMYAGCWSETLQFNIANATSMRVNTQASNRYRLLTLIKGKRNGSNAWHAACTLRLRERNTIVACPVSGQDRRAIWGRFAAHRARREIKGLAQ